MVSLRVSLNKGRIKEINQVASRGFENARSGLLRNGDESIVVPLSGIGFTGSLDGLRAILLEVGRLGVGLSAVGHRASSVRRRESEAHEKSERSEVGRSWRLLSDARRWILYVGFETTRARTSMNQEHRNGVMSCW